MKPVPYPFVIKNAVDQRFIDHVRHLILESADQFTGNPVSANRKFLKMDYVTPEGDRLLYEVKVALAKRYDLGEYIVPPNLKDFIGYITSAT